jgi:hypothetical protein
MHSCTACRGPIDGAALTDPESGAAFHPACAAQRLPGDLATTAFAFALAVLVPPAVVWAG